MPTIAQLEAAKTQAARDLQVAWDAAMAHARKINHHDPMTYVARRTSRQRKAYDAAVLALYIATR